VEKVACPGTQHKLYARLGLEPGPLNPKLIALKDHSLIMGCGGWVGEEKLGGDIEENSMRPPSLPFTGKGCSKTPILSFLDAVKHQFLVS